MTEKIIDPNTGEEVEMDVLPLPIPSVLARTSKILHITVINERGQWIHCSIEFHPEEVAKEDPVKKVDVRLDLN